VDNKQKIKILNEDITYESLKCPDSPFSLCNVNPDKELLEDINPKLVIGSVAKLLHTRLLKDKLKFNYDTYHYKTYYHLFDEKTYFTPETDTDAFSKELNVKDIYYFLEALLARCDLSTKYAVIVLIYINLFLKKTEFRLYYGNIRTIIFISLIVAQKVYDEYTISNKVFSEQIYEFYPNGDLNKIESAFCILVDFQFYIKRSEYIKHRMMIDEVIFTFRFYNNLGFFQEGNLARDLPEEIVKNKSSNMQMYLILR